jgi:hypothetical protein
VTVIYVFSSDPEGHHLKGAARHARKHYGARFGQSDGPQGNAYAIISKDIHSGVSGKFPAVFTASVARFLQYASDHPKLEFQLSNIGCNLAGFTAVQVAALFKEATPNIRFPKEWDFIPKRPDSRSA